VTEEKEKDSPVKPGTVRQGVFSWKKLLEMAAIGVGLGVGTLYLGYRQTGSGILGGLPLGLFNYYLACRAVGYLGAEKGTKLFARTIALRWVFALAALLVALWLGGPWLLLGVALGVEIQMLSQLADAAKLVMGLGKAK
jgi:hypothetical protein